MTHFLSESTQHLRRWLIQRGASVGSIQTNAFADGERSYRLLEDVRRAHVTVLASVTADPASLFDLLAIFRILREHRTHTPGVVIPYLGYARQDHPAEDETAVGILVAELIRNLNPSSVAVLDPHSDVVVRALGPNTRTLTAIPLFAAHLLEEGAVDLVISPDESGRARASALASAMQVSDVGYIEKTRPKPNTASARALHGDVRGKRVVIFDDMIDTGGTIAEAVKLVAKHGATDIRVAATHGLFSGEAREKLARLPVREICVTNSLQQPRHPSIHTLDVTPILLT